MIKDLYEIEELTKKYISIVQEEYKDYIPKELQEYLIKNDSFVKYSEKGISFYVRDRVIYLPKIAYDYFEKLKTFPQYGTYPNKYRKVEDYLDTNTTYYDYIDHVVGDALTPLDYFKESLLHEVMHLCGSKGANPLDEGFNELIARELASKYSIEFAAYGYPKEVEIAKRLEDIIGKETTDQLIFMNYNQKIDLLRSKNPDIANLYINVHNKMIELSKDYFDTLSNVVDPYVKADNYSKIDYSEVHKMIDIFNEDKQVNRR